MNPASASRLRPSVLAALAFTLLYVIVAAVGAVRAGNQEFVFYIVVMFVLIAFAGFVHLRINLSSGVVWALSLWGLAHMAGGLVTVPADWPINGDIRVLYSWWLIPNYLKFDHLVHAFGFGTTTWVCYEGLCSILYGSGSQPRTAPTIGMLTLSAAAGLGFGALNEVVEFVATLLVPETNVGGYINTGWDLVANLVGSLLACVLIVASRAFSQSR